MSQRAIDHIEADIDRIIDRARHEYEITYAEIVGILTVKAHVLSIEAHERHERKEELGTD